MLNGFGRKGFYNSQEVGLGRAIAAHGHTVTIYKGVRMNEKAETHACGEGVTIHYIPMHRFGPHGYLKTSLLEKDTDALLCFSDQQQFIPHIEAFCRKNNIIFVPYVGTAHSLHSGLRAKVMDFLFSLGTLRLYHRMPVLAKTDSAREELRSLGVQDITVANVGLDATELNHQFRSADRAQLKEKWGFTADDVIICNVARLDPEKRPLDLVELFDHVKDHRQYRLLIIGEGALRSQLEEKIAALSLSDRVKLINRVPYANMWEIYTMSDYFLNLNKGEIFGMAIMEAVFYCTSVAASSALGPRTTLAGMAGHKLCDDDAEMEAWLTSPYPTEDELRESSAKMIRDFSWNRCAEAFLSIVAKKKAVASPSQTIPA
jgi:1,2-diacylglycerol 3-alpha-glucosyltransferase